MDYEVIEQRTEPGVWSVEAIDPSGNVFKTNFYGPDSRQRAEEYAAFKSDRELQRKD